MISPHKQYGWQSTDLRIISKYKRPPTRKKHIKNTVPTRKIQCIPLENLRLAKTQYVLLVIGGNNESHASAAARAVGASECLNQYKRRPPQDQDGASQDLHGAAAVRAVCALMWLCDCPHGTGRGLCQRLRHRAHQRGAGVASC